MFALFEAGFQVVRTIPTPRFGFASRGANHVAPLRGAGGPGSPCGSYIITIYMIGCSTISIRKSDDAYFFPTKVA